MRCFKNEHYLIENNAFCNFFRKTRTAAFRRYSSKTLKKYYNCLKNLNFDRSFLFDGLIAGGHGQYDFDQF